MYFNIGDKVKTVYDVFSDTDFDKSGAKNLGKEIFVVKETQWWEQGKGHIVIGVSSDKRKGKVWHHENDLIKL